MSSYEAVGAVSSTLKQLLTDRIDIPPGVVGPIRIYKRARPANAPRPLHDPEQVHAEHVAQQKKEE